MRRVERAENNVAVGDFIQNAVLVVSLDTSGFMSPLSPTSQSPSATDPPSFQIDPDIRTAQTPPSVLYHDPAYVAHQKDTVFARSWHLVGDARELKTTGSVKPFTLLEGCLDEPLFLIRDDEQALRCLSNVCTHRGNILAEGEGHLSGTSIPKRRPW